MHTGGVVHHFGQEIWGALSISTFSVGLGGHVPLACGLLDSLALGGA